MATQKSQVYVCGECGNTVEVLNAGEGTLKCCGKPMNLRRADGAVTEPHVLLGVHVTDRAHHAAGVQGVLSEHAPAIRTRLGLHDVHGDYCSPNGLIVLELIGDDNTCREITDRLSAIDGIEVQQMIFGH
jgi:desulfoferrodoxin-like iron-binding protein